MSLVRATAPGFLIALLLTLVPGARPGGAEEIALIDDIVVNGLRPEEPTAENLSVLVAATGETVTGRRGMGLSADDEVRSGAGVQTVLRFLNLEPDIDPLVFIDESSAYQVVDSTTLRGFFGRLFASVSGLFSVITPGGRLGVEGTEFEVLIAADGGVDIQVLEGVVAFEPEGVDETSPPVAAPQPAPDAPQEPAPAGPGIAIRIDSGAQKTVEMGMTVNNGCPRAERFFIDSPAAMPWVRIVAEPQPVEVPAGGSAVAETEVWVDAAGVEPGLYRGEIVLRCHECDTCTVTRSTAPLAIEVVEAAIETETRPEDDPTEGREAAAVRIQALERLSLEGAGRAAAPKKMAEGEVVNVLDWTDQVFVAVQPTYAAAGDAPHFDDVEERSRAFRAARYEAVWRENPKARAELGNVYKDWGEDRRASKAYKQAAQADASFTASADFLASWAEANRRAGRLDRAQEQAARAVDLDPGSGRAHVAQGNVYRGKASMATEAGDPADEALYLERSVEAFKAASAGSDPAGDAKARRTKGVAETRLAETYTALAKSALAKGEAAEADRRLIEAEQAVRAADSAYSKAENPFLLLAEGQVLQERARLAKARGDEDGSRRQLDQAQQTYSAALAKHKDLAPAYYRIATVYEERGDAELAEREYEKAVETQPTYSPSYKSLGRLKEVKDPGSGTAYIGRDLKLISPDKVVRPPRDTRAVPRVTGMVLEQAEQALAETGFVPGDISREPSAERLGTVIRQSPAAGSQAPKGTRVALTLALPTGSFAMPDVRGLDVAGAQLRLAEHGLGPARIQRNEKKGRTRSEVTGQSPRPGRKVAAGRLVELEVTVPKPVKVPGVVGRSEREAIDKLGKEGFTGGGVTRQPSCESAGRVLRQSPEKGARLAPGSPVALVIAAPGSDSRPVPALVGVSRREAEELLSRSGFRLGEVDEREDDRPPGTVLVQRPEARATLGAGCPVALTVAKPVALVEVPKLVGESISELQRTLSRVALSVAGFRLGEVTAIATNNYAQGTVVRQSPAAGSRAPRDSTIDVWVAGGTTTAPQRPVVPDLRGQPAKQAAELLREMGLRPTISGNCHKVQRQSPAAGTPVSPGSMVKLSTGNCVQ